MFEWIADKFSDKFELAMDFDIFCLSRKILHCT